MSISFRRAIPLVAILLASTQAPHAQGDTLATAFSNPPDSAKPHTWWHWMDGNITREGITADLEAMKSAGIGGAQLFHVSQHIPPGTVGYMSPQWRQMVLHAVKEADRLGMELCIHNCAGWSSSGGPWITPEHAMQVIAWSNKKLRGPARFAEVLPDIKAPKVAKAIPWCRDIAVLAWPVPPEGDKTLPAKGILGKTGVTRQNLPDPDTATTEPAAAVIRANSIVVLTDKMDGSGRLTWDVPKGDWIILRIGYTPTGRPNHPAPPEGEGLEVDKLSREALDAHWNGMMAKVIEDAGPLAGKVLNNALIDSYEVGNQNWTPKFREEFRQRRGYDLLKYLPVITGRTVGSREESERFLWDFRRTIADLYAVNYFGHFRDLCHKNGMKFSTEPYGNGGFDNLQCGGLADIPMGEFWVGGHYMRSTRLAASAAHTNARQIVGAESFTASLAGGRYALEPYGVKTLGDLAFCNGINRYIFHRYAHQPWMNLVPGMTMGKWGMHLERTITWWNEASEWFKYIARCQYLLQEGSFVADAVYFYGEGAPNDLPERSRLCPAMPDGHDYDGCDVSVLMNRMSVRDGRIVLPDGMSYAVLVLPDSKFMTPRVAGKIRDLVRTGATVVGPKPQLSPSLSEYPECDGEVRRIAEEVWGSVDGDRVKERAFGSGRVIWGKPMEEVFAQLDLPRDFDYRPVTRNARLASIHRRIGDADVYFVSNQLYGVVEANCSFRVAGRAPEFWHSDTGTTEPAPVYREEGARTIVPLRLDPAESVFVLFRRPATRDHLTQITCSAQAGASSPPTPRIHVRKASYETTDRVKSIDVTSLVAQMVAEGVYDIPATADLFGDPARGAPKQLRLEYERDGKAMTTTVGDRAVIMLVDIASAGAFPPYELSAGPGGSTTLIPWQAGDYTTCYADGTTHTSHVGEPAREMKVTSPWTLRFPAGLGAPASVPLDNLISWNDHADPGVRYFSGTAEYVTDLEVRADIIGPENAVLLDLGSVKNFATVRLNGTDLGVLWKAPFRVDASRAIRPGKNRLVVKVTNLWPNRLIGDEQLPADVEWEDDHLKAWPDWMLNGKARPSGRVTFTTWRFFDKDSPLLESGLLGPVTLRSARCVPADQ